MKVRSWFSILLIISFFCGCGLQIKPLPSVLAKLEAQKKEIEDPDIVYRFFDEEFAAGGYEWHYPDESKVFIEEESGKNGEVALRMDLVADDYSGGAVELWNTLYNLKPYYRAGALEFWIKGSVGGEIACAELGDDEDGDGYLVRVKVPLNKYNDITSDWTHFSIPLADFGKRGMWWDEKKQIEVPMRFDWDKVGVFEITIEKGDNKKFSIWVDDVFIIKDRFEPAPDVEEEYWDEREEIISLPPVAKRPEVKIMTTVFQDDITGNMFSHGYGGKTAKRIQKTTDTEKNPSVIGIYLDNTDYSGININFGKKVDLSEARKTKAGLAFWAKFGKDVTQVFVGLLDDNSDNKMVQTNVVLRDFAELDTNWHYFMIPLKEFDSQGNWWDENKKMEVPGEVDWGRITELCFSSDKYGNRLEDGIPVTIYVDDISFIEEVPGYVDPDDYWNAFKSEEPDLVIFDFEDPKEAMWSAVSGEESEIFFKVIDQEDRSLREKFGKKMFEIEYANNDWGYVAYPFAKHSAPMEMRNWSKHWALRFDFHTERDEEIIRIHINDSGKEAFVASVTCKKGWNDILLPLRNFKKYPYYQEADAVLNNKLDLDAVTAVEFRPAVAGTMGKFKLDNLKLTNTREVKE